MSPSKISDLVQGKEVEGCRGGILKGIGFERQGSGARFHVFEEFAVVAWAVAAEVLEDAGEGIFGDGDLEEVVAEWDLLCVIERTLQVGKRGAYHAIICTRFATKRHRFIRDAFIDYAIWKHGLAGDAKDECSEGSVISWLTLSPHTSERVNFRRLASLKKGKKMDVPTVHYFVDFGHSVGNFLHADVEGHAIITLACIES